MKTYAAKAVEITRLRAFLAAAVAPAGVRSRVVRRVHVRQIARATEPSVESIKQRRNLLEARGDLDRLRLKLDRTERALDTLSSVLSLIPDPIEVVAPDYTVLYANRASRLLHDDDQLEGSIYYQSIMGLQAPPEDCPIRRAVRDDREAAYTATCDNGDEFEVAVTPLELSDGRRAAMCLSKLVPAAAAVENRKGDTGAAGEPRGEAIPFVDQLAVDEPNDAIATFADGETMEGEVRLLQKIAELSTETLDVVLEQVTDGVLMMDTFGRPIMANTAFRELIGVHDTEAIDMELVSQVLFPGRKAGASPTGVLVELSAGGKTARFETAIARCDGDRIPVELAVSRVPGDSADETVLLVTTRDLRGSNELKDQLIKALNLSAAGEPIAGLAHQVNNCLTPALYHADKLARHHNLDRKSQQSITTIQEYLNLCHESITTVLSLMRPAVPSTINMNHLTSEVFSRQYLADELRMDNIEVVQRYDPAMVETTGYRVLLQQALANVIKNAQEALLREGGGGRLMVLTEASPTTITVRISDNGPGIPPDVQEKMFDLLFTTKPPGKGYGVGLLFAKEVIERHGGTIEAKSRPGEGATFSIHLPVRHADDPTGEGVAADWARTGPKPLKALRGRILIVDEDPGTLDLLTDILSAAGHTVTPLLDASEALDKIRSNEFDCVVCGARIPGFDSNESFRRVSELNGGFYDRLVLITGEGSDHDTDAFIKEAGAPCIEKPFTAERVNEVVQSVLSRRGD
jgi:PAS domain S-box-containing protein